MKHKKTYKIRIEEYDNNFYPQIFLIGFFTYVWLYINETSPDKFECCHKRYEPKVWTKSLELAEKFTKRFIDQHSKKAIKYHNERTIEL